MSLDALNGGMEREFDALSHGFNIYNREIVAKNYDKNFIRAFRQIEFEKLIPQILTIHCDNGWKQLKVFEGGVGTGLFTIPIINYLLQRDSKSFLVGRDNSKAMLEELFKKPEFQSIQDRAEGRVSLGYGDLEQEDGYPKIEFNILFFAGVLHCLANQHFFLKQIDRILEKAGILIMIFKTDVFTRLQCGERSSYPSVDTHYGNFWRYYYHLRDYYNIPINPRCRFIYDASAVNKLIQRQFNACYELQKIYEFTWPSVVPLDKIIYSIEHGLTFATGQGVSPGMREKLAEEMRGWLSWNHRQNKEVEIDHKMELVVWKKTV